jgi:hypothetical protein
MANLVSPSITIAFIEQAASAINRGERGIVALALVDSAQSQFTVYSITDIPANLSAANKGYIKDALVGYTSAPRKVEVYVMANSDDDSYTAMMNYFETVRFNYFACPTIETDGKTADIVTWIKGCRERDIIAKAVLPETNSADCEGIIAWNTALAKGTTAVSTAEACPRIAGLLAGTGLELSATYAPLADYTDCARLTKAEQDAAVTAGKLIAFWDGEKVKLNRAVTSFQTTTATKGDSFKKIKLVEDMDMIKYDIMTTIRDNYIGKYANSYDNKCLLVTAINAYFRELINEGVLASGTCAIDVDAQAAYLVGKGIDISDMTEQEIKEANTGSEVFLRATISILDALEDVTFNIYI